MSGYLVNLARRSAGLAPAVRVRPRPPVMSLETPGEPSGPVEATAAEWPANTLATPLTPTVNHLLPLAPGGPAPIVTHVTQTSATAPAAQRLVAAVPGAASPTVASAIVPLATRTTPAAAAPPPTLPNPSLGAPTIAAFAIEPAAAAATPSAPIVRERLDIHTTTVVPAASVRVEAPPSSPRIEAPVAAVDVPRTTAHQTYEQTTLATQPTARIEPAPQPPPIAPAIAPPKPARSDATRESERTVHVRIGAIEIRADSAVAPLPPAPVATAAAVPPAGNAGGFDDFARLRSYAPWQW